MQADIARHVRADHPEQSEVALDAISRASAEALRELRSTLGTIAPDGDRVPMPGLDRLDALCARMRDAGVAVDLVVLGDRRPVPSALDVAAYRIVQESLTNVARHARERRATVTLEYRPDAIRLEVVDPGPAGTAEEGFGLRGIRRRAAEVGGTVDIHTGDRFSITAVLPT
jgi:signal transduction histidine kinase